MLVALFGLTCNNPFSLTELITAKLAGTKHSSQVTGAGHCSTDKCN